MILITGGSGQLGHALVVQARGRGLACTEVTRPMFDFEQPETIAECFAKTAPSLVINAAAYTLVDAAETNPDAAKAGNHLGPLALARLCAAADIPLLHISTDYVFDGAKGAPYLEQDATNPAGVYGTTKRDGEVAVLASSAKAIILRTAWVYGAHGKNFARTMLSAGQKMPLLRVVADQRGTPTSANDLAHAILQIVYNVQSTGWADHYRGIYHATGAGETTWHGFAGAIFEHAAALGRTPPQLQPISTADWPTPARRPADSRLDNGKLAEVFGVRLPDWRASVGGVVREILAEP